MKNKVLVFGDIMIDEYVHVVTKRKAPEADIPVWDEVGRNLRLGGAANVANNVRSLGDVQVALVGICETKDMEYIAYHDIDVSSCVDGRTMLKTRYVDSNENIILRADNFTNFSKSDLCAPKLRDLMERYKFDIVIISDYNKGTIGEESINVIRELHDGPVVVDSKRKDLRLFSGFTVLKVNEHEYDVQVASPHYTHVEKLFDYVVVTRGAKGADLKQRDAVKSHDVRYVINTESFPVEQVKAKDVTGCGDTHTAAMSFSLLKNPDIRFAVKFANACARSVVQKFGTSVPGAVE